MKKVKTPKHSSSVSTPGYQRRLFWWLVLLLLVLPVVAWEVALRSHSEVTTRLQQGKVYHSNPGPWGNLEYIRIAIELPDRFIDVDHTDAVNWFFRDYNQEQLREFFKGCDLSPAQLDALFRTAKWHAEPEGCYVSPEDDWIWKLSPKSRQKIYDELDDFEENIDQRYAFVYRPEYLSERFEFSGLKDETIRMFQRLLYPRGNLVCFADSDLVLRKLSDKHERLRFVKTVTRRSSLLVKVDIDSKTDIDALLNYWGQGGRAKDLRPLLESLSRVPEGCKIDLAHLLPPFARSRIYTFPSPSEESASLKQDCHWTSLNFFNETPNGGFAGPEEIQKMIESEYMQVGDNTAQARYGDVVFLTTSQGILIHSAVYIADNIVFTKNGAGLNQPWIYMKMEDMVPYYTMPKDTLHIAVYRKKDI